MDGSDEHSLNPKLQKFIGYCNEHISSPITLSQYRMLNCKSYATLFEEMKKKQIEIQDIIPLALSNLNCSQFFEKILKKIKHIDSGIKSSNDLFHLLFQKSEPILKSICINQYSFTNPIPFYFPIINTSLHETQFTICKELWYSLTPHNAVISFGLGSAAKNGIGKSTLLDLIFELNFTQSNTFDSCFHSNSIGLRLTKNFYPKESCERYFTDWAFFDCHTPTPLNFVNLLLKHVSIIIVHILESDMFNEEFDTIERDLRLLNLEDKNIFIFIRDITDKQRSYKTFRDLVNYKIIRVSNLKGDIQEIERQELKSVGKDIILLGSKNLRFTSKNLEVLIKDFDTKLWEEIQVSQRLLNDIIDRITTQNSNEGISYDFLSYYPIFIDLMRKKYQLSREKDGQIMEKLNMECTECFKKLNHIKQCCVNKIFSQILSDEKCILILGKLVLELQQITNEKFSLSEPKEQANDKYSVEILWREAILCQKFCNKNSISPENDYFNNLSRSLCSLVQSGEPFELVDGDNLEFFSKELNSLLRHHHVRQTDFVHSYNRSLGKITEAPIVLSIIGPQSSGKSTLLNYVFGCKFLTSSGRCTRGVYGSVMELSEPLNDSKFFLILDTEGINAIEREEITTASNIHFDRSLILFCLSVSNVVIINLPREIDAKIKEILQICAFSLNLLKVKRISLPKIIFVLNKVSDPNLSNRQIALKILIKSLDMEVQNTKHSDKIKLSDQINLTEKDLFTLPSAFNSDVVDDPTEEIFNKGVVKQVPTYNFALECSNLRQSIFEKIKAIETCRPKFTNISEWLDMAAGTWDSIIRFQEIIKYGDLNEIKFHRNLEMLVDELMEKYFFSRQKFFRDKLKDISNEIFALFTLKSTDLKDEKNKKMQDFDNNFDAIGTRCLLEYANTAPEFNKSRSIQAEHNSRLERLISIEKLNYKVFLNTRTSEIYSHLKRKECFEDFKKEITSDPKRFVEFNSSALSEEFEKLWKEKFENNNFEESYQTQNLQDFSLIFYNEMNLINEQEIFRIYMQYKYNSDEIIANLLMKIFEQLTNTNEGDKPYFYPTKQGTSLRDIQPYLHSKQLDYLSVGDLYSVHSTEGQESKYIKYFENNKAIYKNTWVPTDCVPLLQSCSGYYSHHDIDWGDLSSNKQINKLASNLMKKQNIESDHSAFKIPKILEHLINDVSKVIQEDPEIQLSTIKLIANAIQKRIDIFNHEISHIGAELTLYACRDIYSYFFSLAFKSYYSKKWDLYLENLKNISAEKIQLKDYFLTKVKISKIIFLNKTSTNAPNSGMYDISISKKYGCMLLTELNRRAKYSSLKATDKRLCSEYFTFNSLVSEAKRIISKAINDGENCKNDITDFIVKYYCDRNNALKFIFEERWKEFIDSNRKEIIEEAIQTQRDMVNELVNELEKCLLLLKRKDIPLLNAVNLFKPLKKQNKEVDSFQLIESPYRSLTKFLCILMNPGLKSDGLKYIFDKEFQCDGVAMRRCYDGVIKNKVIDSF